MAPGIMMLLCDSLSGSVNATQRTSFPTRGSVKRLSELVNSAFWHATGQLIIVSSPILWISLLSGGLTAPTNPGQAD